MLVRSSRAPRRKQIAVVVVAVLAFVGFAAYRTQSAAEAHEEHLTMAMTCAVVGPMNVDYTVSHTPVAGAVAGQTFTLDVKSAVVIPGAYDFPVISMQLTIPIPAGVTGGGDVMVMSGSFTKASQTTDGGSLVVNLDAKAGTTTKNLVAPGLMIPVGIPADAAGETIVFAGPSKLVTTVDFAGTPVPAECTPNDGNPALVTTKVAPAGSTPATTAAPGPTTKPGTATPTTKAPATAGGGGTPKPGGPPKAVSATPNYTG
jgi:hypothetical protein